MKLTLRVTSSSPFSRHRGEVETARLHRFMAAAQTSIRESMIDDIVEIETVGNLVSDILTTELRAEVWGEKSGVIKISVPASWWQELKRSVRDWLTSKLGDDDGELPASLVFINRISVDYETTVYEVRKLHPSFVKPAGQDEPVVCVRVSGSLPGPSALHSKRRPA